MNEKIKTQLTGIPETMLITVWAKATENNQPHPILRDPKASEIMDKIDYDFSKFKSGKMSQVGSCIRAKLIDDETHKFLSEHKEAVVIQLGAGIDARYERIGNTELTHWYDLDLPEGIKLRRQFLQETDKNTYISGSLFDYSWVDQVKSHNKPVLIIIEGVTMYFDPSEMKSFFTELAHRFDQATVLFDTLVYAAVGHSKQHDTLRKFGDSVSFKWSEKRATDMEAWDPKIHIAKEYYMSDHEQGRYPWFMRLLYKIPYCYRYFNQRIIRLEIK